MTHLHTDNHLVSAPNRFSKEKMGCGTKRNESFTTLAGKTTIVTGANTGIGYVTALDFAMRGARVILACRNQQKAEEARQKIINATGNPNVVVKQIDFQLLASVRKFAMDFNESETRLDILVNNAAATFLGDEKTKDGLDVTMQTNHFSPFLLTHLLMDKLKSSSPSRIVNVSARAAGRVKNMKPHELNEYPRGGKTASAVNQYWRTKFCSMLFTAELARRLEGTGVTANTLHPGAIKTELSRGAPEFFQGVLALFGGFLLTPEEGAQTTIYVAISKDLEGVNGQLFDNCRQIEMYKNVKDVALARQVWARCEEFVHLKEEEKLLY